MSENTVFGPGYAGFYDHFYAAKDYAAECDFLEEVFQRYAPGPVGTILDLGCGTGGHALILAQRGYRVTGVDRSESMLAAARAKAGASGLPNPPIFLQGDIRSLDLGQTYDAVIAMFAVMGYMVSNEDLAAALRSARRHLAQAQLLVFDAWYGPAVLTERPTARIKTMDINGERVIRLAQPELDLLRHTVDVHYRVLRLQGSCLLEESEEVHRMRFLFPQEIVYHLEQAGFQAQCLCPFLHLNDVLVERDWNMAVVAQAV